MLFSEKMELICQSNIFVAASSMPFNLIATTPQQLGYYDHRHWQIAPGRYRIRVGASSQDFRLEGIVTLKGSEVTMPLRTVYFSETY